MGADVQVIDGKLVSQKRRLEMTERVREFQKNYKRAPGLGVILVGEDPASQVYVKNKVLASEQVGLLSKKIILDRAASESEILDAVKKMNLDPEVDGFLVQLPLPKNLNTEKILDAISPLKDADGLHPENLGLLWAGRERVVPCTPQGVMHLLEHYNVKLAGKNAVVVGRSQIVGKPMAHLLVQADATVTVVHSKTENLKQYLQGADVVVVAAGRANMFGREDFKEGAVVVDVGIHRLSSGVLCGDVRYSELQGWAAAATPVPGGVGPMTITCLLENTIRLAELREGK